MPTDKASYLAAHYLTADTKPLTKKRKRKHPSGKNNDDGLLIIQDDDDDDESSWGATNSRRSNENDDDADGPVTVAGTSAEFRRSKKSAWKSLSGAPVPPPSSSAQQQQQRQQKDDDSAAAAAADAIIASAAAEQAAAARLADGETDDPGPVPGTVPMMSDGTHAGLQSAAAITAQLRLRQQAEREELARLNAERAAAGDVAAEQPELVLRDATGRRVDVAMRRAEMRRAAADAEKAAEARVRALKGDVQLAEARRRREALEDAALMPLARGKDDEAMNADMRAARRWNDPMAEFLGDGEEAGAGAGKKGGGRGGGGIKGRRPVYKGAAAPNRYGIRPGYRWDGVDRGNGFEAERFKAINRKERVKGLEYAWQMDE